VSGIGAHRQLRGLRNHGGKDEVGNVCEQGDRVHRSNAFFRPHFGLQMARLLLKDQSTTNYEALVSPPLRITDASFIAEGPLDD
jgi:hypothetical protein